MGLLGSATTAARLYLLRRRQYDNERLRAFFRRRYRVDVGLYSYGCFDPWRMRGPMRVGRYCSIASSVRTALGNHPMNALTTHPALYERAFGVVEVDIALDELLVIEDDVWIGHNATILPGCKHIGRGAIIGAGSIVTRDVEAYSVVAGVPARKVRDRFPPELAKAIDNTRWWELDLRGLRNLVIERPDLVYHPTLEAVGQWGGMPPAR
jgi:virginiamycin A acetyltransferase